MKNNRGIFQYLTLILQIGLNMLVPIVGCTLFGAWLGKKYEIPAITILFFIVGALAGFTSVFRMTKKMIDQDKNKDE